LRRSFRRDAETNTRDACAPQNSDATRLRPAIAGLRRGKQSASLQFFLRRRNARNGSRRGGSSSPLRAVGSTEQEALLDAKIWRRSRLINIALASFAKATARQGRSRSTYFGITLGSTSGLGIGDAAGDGVGVASGVSTAPLFVVKTPPDRVTSSTRYNWPLRRSKSFAST
jgi:hypothetical protein